MSINKPPFSKNQVWWFNQTGSRENTNPSQPPDPDKSRRMLIILSRVIQNQVTCVPILTLAPQQKVTFTEVELLKSNYQNFLQNDSYVACYNIVTVPTKYFQTYLANIKMYEMAKIEKAIKLHLGYK